MLYLTISLSKTNTNKRFDAPVLSNLGNSQVSHRDDFVWFKVTCKGPHKFGITMQLCGKAGLLTIETLKSEAKKSLTLHSINFRVPFDFV